MTLPSGEGPGLLAGDDVRVHDLPLRPQAGPAGADGEGLRADVLDVVQEVVAVPAAAQHLVALDLEGGAAAGLLLQLHHSVRHEVVHDLADVHADDRLAVTVDGLLHGRVLAHGSSLGRDTMGNIRRRRGRVNAAGYRRRPASVRTTEPSRRGTMP